MKLVSAEIVIEVIQTEPQSSVWVFLMPKHIVNMLFPGFERFGRIKCYTKP